jgi:hypothetical protein
MAKRTGEVTEDYLTYFKHLLTAFTFGGLFGIIGTVIGVYTDWYIIILQRAWYMVVMLFLIVAVYLYFKLKGKARKNK